jgi:pSer/pThr/pTyr-binding forkhead associated (FHA) protein
MSVYKLKGTSGSVINQSFPFEDLIVLGSSSDCDIQLDETGVASRHAEIRLLDDKALQLKDLGSEAGTLLNGEAVTETLLARSSA